MTSLSVTSLYLIHISILLSRYFEKMFCCFFSFRMWLFLVWIETVSSLFQVSTVHSSVPKTHHRHQIDCAILCVLPGIRLRASTMSYCSNGLQRQHPLVGTGSLIMCLEEQNSLSTWVSAPKWEVQRSPWLLALAWPWPSH